MLSSNTASRFLNFCFFGGSWPPSGSSATPSAGTTIGATADSSARGSPADTSATRAATS